MWLLKVKAFYIHVCCGIFFQASYGISVDIQQVDKENVYIHKQVLFSQEKKKKAKLIHLQPKDGTEDDLVKLHKLRCTLNVDPIFKK